MSTARIQLELSEDLAHLLDPSGQDVTGRALEVLVLHFVERGTISSGRAAELLNIREDDLLALLAEHGIPFFNLTIDEVLEDASVAKRTRQPLAS